jgi:hypothetical protein
MKLSSFRVQLPVLLAALTVAAGCSTQPASSAKAPAAPASAAARTPASAPAVAKTTSAIPASAMALAPAAPAMVSKVPEAPVAPLSTEAAEFVARFTQPAGGDHLPHQLSDTTSFPEAMPSLQAGARAPKLEYVPNPSSMAPVQGLTADGNSTQLIVRDWTGLVLVPISTSLSVAHTSSVRLLKVEAHPLSDGRVRIWVRVQNAARQDLLSEVACSFRLQSGKTVASPYFYELAVPSGGFRDVFFVSPEGTLSTYTVLVRQGK